jgi:hypothetical protein
MLKAVLPCLLLCLAACTSSTLLDEDGDQVPPQEITISASRDLTGALEPDQNPDLNPEGTTPDLSIPEETWQDDFVSPSAATVGSTKWKKGKIVSTAVKDGYWGESLYQDTTITVSTAGNYTVKFNKAKGSFKAVRVTGNKSILFSVPPSYSNRFTAWASFGAWDVFYDRTDHEYRLNLVAGKKVWQATGATRVVNNVKPKKVVVKRLSAWQPV